MLDYMWYRVVILRSPCKYGLLFVLCIIRVFSLAVCLRDAGYPIGLSLVIASVRAASVISGPESVSGIE
jgi:hypothetical protein